ncbi:MAG: hypothetical protein K9H61_11865 [Bacteroidia bacterium]|nr:hypothetical protein [Bacteroidia bacterium]MCF8425176.1 hypothetical protein [Bacteroidia bacterium]MCF8447683.1 hypothetical protein [Bacteroidia bacterium]
MLDRDFCDFLEFEICKAFENSANEQIKGFWCDGVLLKKDENDYSQKLVINKRQVQLKAFIGKDGQTEYELTLRFGEKALSQFVKKLSIKNCFPNASAPNWFEIDTK